MEFAASGGCVQVEEWVLTGLRCQGEQVCPEGRPGRLVGDVGHDLVGSAVEHLNDLGSEELLGCHLNAVGVTPGGVKQPSSRVAPFPQHRGGRGGGVIAGEDLLEHLGRPTRCHGIRSNDGVRVAVADDL